MSNANSLELGMLNLVNAERAAEGLDPLRLITNLNAAAEQHSAWMLDTDMFSHTGENGSSPSDRMAEAGYAFEGASMALENIGWQSARGAEGFEDDVAQVHAGLMNSPGHRANILNPDAEDIGIGIEIGTFSGAGGDYEAVMVTQVFGTTEADQSAFIDPMTGTSDDDMVVDEEPVEETPVDEEPVDDMPVEDDPVEEDDPVDEDPVEDTPDEDTPVDDTPDDEESPEEEVEDDEGDPVSEDDTPVADDPEGDDDEDIPEEEEPDVVAEDDMPDDDAGDDPADPEDEDVVMEDDDPVEDDDADMPVCPVDDGAGQPLPFELANFSVDLRSAFEFTRDGDQFIWTTTEDKLFEVFMDAFEDWAGMALEGEVVEEDAMADLMVEGPDTDGCFLQTEEDEVNEMLLESCV